MKNYKKIKTIQLLLYILITFNGLSIIFLRSEVFQNVGRDFNLLILCVLLWVSLGISFIFVYLDLRYLSSYRSDYSELDFALRTDNVAGIANRYSCDAIIEKYADKPLPENIGSIMFEITNIQQINKEFGHTVGNSIIRDFSSMIKVASFNVCFVGRNGGNKFLSLFEDATEEKMESFFNKFNDKINQYNENNPKCQIEYKYGIAFKEGKSVQSITELIALSNKRIYED